MRAGRRSSSRCFFPSIHRQRKPLPTEESTVSVSWPVVGCFLHPLFVRGASRGPCWSRLQGVPAVAPKVLSHALQR